MISFSSKTTSNVAITQVITESELIDQTNRLDEVLNQSNLSDYCRQRADQTLDQHTRLVWYFLKSNFEENPRLEMLNLLGFDKKDVATKFNALTTVMGKHVDDLSHQMNNINTDDENNEKMFETIASDYQDTKKIESKKEITFSLKTGSGLFYF